LMTMIATKSELAWNWKMFEWDDESEYYSWIDRVGQLAIAYFLIGITWAIGEAEIDGMLWSIWAVFLSGVAIQGFRDETETPWRRGIGSLGSIFALFMLSFTFDNELYTYVTWMFLGVVALGFGFAYISRMGETSTIFEPEYTDIKDALIEDSNDDGSNPSIPEPIISESIEADEEEDIEVVDETDDVEVVDEADEEEEDEIVMKGDRSAPSPQANLNYDLQLDQSVLAAIQNSLANTPHQGFKPVVSIGTNGNVKIDFIPL
jgi:hypothetical protein